MTHENPATTTVSLTARAEYHTDWHVCIDDPARGPLGYCTGTGTGADEPFDPDVAAQALMALFEFPHSVISGLPKLLS
ncbi:hypothetical protein ACFRQM_48330 [Streptomyces sp. NPDC056831]|uniref:hypothetical protein n=1 Tax=Streptomyces sp. NPDC056831 TaxID=3345954 RepID=UPI00367AF93D